MLITLDEYKKFFANEYNFHFRDCSILNENVFTFVMEPELSDKQLEEEKINGWDPELRAKGICMLNFKKDPGKMWACKYLAGWKELINGSSTLPTPETINIQTTSLYPSFSKRVYVLGGPVPVEEPPLEAHSLPNDKNNFVRGAVSKIKSIDGYAYVSGGMRSFGKRVGKNEWESYTHLFKINNTLEEIGSLGFSDFDGFSSNEIYLVGGLGDVWHFDGTKSRRISFPSNIPIYSICCAKDGYAYIAGLNGDIFKGKGNSWKKITTANLSLPIKDMVWHEDRVWCTNDYGIFSIKNDKFQKEILPNDIAVSAGNMTSSHGTLLVAGLGGAAFHRNGKWESIIDFSKMNILLNL